MTFLFDDIIIGPIHSRRMGVSLGVNLLPTNGKLCNFDCIYCECGWNGKDRSVKLKFNPKDEVLRRVEEVLVQRKEAGEMLDVITFAGNGEPTTHPDFPEIIDSVIELRDKYCPNVKISVLTNATMLGRDAVRHALERVDTAMLKIDSVIEDKIRLINNPHKQYSLDEVIEAIKKFKGEVIIQTMFLHGTEGGKIADNTTDGEVNAWLEVLKDISPSRVVIYSLDRDTPSQTITKVPYEELVKIGEKVSALGIRCEVTK